MKQNFFSVSLVLLLFMTPHSAEARRADASEIEDLRRVQESNGAILAETVQKINTLQIDLQAVKGALEENRHFFEQESQKNDKILRDFDLRLSGMEERLSLFESQLQELMAKGGAKGTAAAPAGDEGELYRKALAEVNAQNFKAALPLFDQFLKKFPKSSMADNAQYWRGEALYGLKQFPEAVLEFQKVVKKYPKSEKVAAAVLKQGYCFFEAKEYLDAKAFLQKVVAQYPQSEEASKARDKIRQIDEILAKPAATAPSARPR
jgi:tol-pal system protein YbgF